MKLETFCQLLQKLRTVEYRMTKAFESSTGFSLTRYQILLYIKTNGDSLQTDIASHLEIDPAAITRHIKILEEKGYVEKHRNKANGREVIVSLTEFCRDEMAKCQANHAEYEVEGVSEETVHEWITLLEKMEKNV